MSLSFTQKMKFAKDLIMNSGKIVTMLKEKSEELFKYEQKTMFENQKGHIKLNGKGECLEVRFSPELLKDQRLLEKQIEKAITEATESMLKYYIEQGKTMSKDIDPELLKQIENEIEENKT